MTLPNLVGCGAGKSGTTSLYYFLGQHPQIYMAAAKEVHYFSRHYDRDVSWYESHFAGSDNASIIGEFSTSYMLDPAVPNRLASLLPSARLLFILRNPIERAYSNYWFSLSIGTQERDKMFSETIRNSEGFDKYIASGFYYEQLQRFLTCFERDQIYVMITEEFKQEPLKQMAMCYEFLGVDTSFRPDVKRRYNVTMTTSNRWLAAIYSSWTIAKQYVKPVFKQLPISLRQNLAEFEKRIMKPVISGDRPDMKDEDRMYLKDIYGPRNERLAEFLGRELQCWQ